MVPKLKLESMKRTSQRPPNRKNIKISSRHINKRKSPDILKRPTKKDSSRKMSSRNVSKKNSGSNMFSQVNSMGESESNQGSEEDYKHSPDFGTSQDSSSKNIKTFQKRSSTMGTKQFEKFQIKISKPEDDKQEMKMKPRKSQTKIKELDFSNRSKLSRRIVPKKSNSSANLNSSVAKNTLGITTTLKNKFRKKRSLRPNDRTKVDLSRAASRFKHSLTHTFIDLE